MGKKIEVVAVERGHCGSMVREVGERFEVDAERIGKEGKATDGSTWFIAADQAEAIPAKSAKSGRAPGAGPERGSKAAE